MITSHAKIFHDGSTFSRNNTKPKRSTMGISEIGRTIRTVEQYLTKKQAL